MSLGFCPFCLHRDEQVNFRQRDLQPFAMVDRTDRESRRKAKHASKMLVCPDCKRRMREDSLLTGDSTTERYADWVFAYPHFWKSIDFGTWSRRLKRWGIADEFWTAYRKLKADRGLA